jgi:hypothetical protein
MDLIDWALIIWIARQHEMSLLFVIANSSFNLALQCFQ